MELRDAGGKRVANDPNFPLLAADVRRIESGWPAWMNPPATLPDTCRPAWLGGSPLQQYLLLRIFGRARDKSTWQAVAHRSSVSMRDLVYAAFPDGPARQNILDKLDYKNREV